MKAHLLSLIIAPANKAIAICGAKPYGRPGHARYKEAEITNKPKAIKTDLFNFIGSGIYPGKNNGRKNKGISFFSHWAPTL